MAISEGDENKIPHFDFQKVTNNSNTFQAFDASIYDPLTSYTTTQSHNINNSFAIS